MWICVWLCIQRCASELGFFCVPLFTASFPVILKTPDVEQMSAVVASFLPRLGALLPGPHVLQTLTSLCLIRPHLPGRSGVDAWWSGVGTWWSGVGAWSGVDVTVTHNHIHLCGASVITSLFNYKNILLQERVINHRVKLYFCSKLSFII